MSSRRRHMCIRSFRPTPSLQTGVISRARWQKIAVSILLHERNVPVRITGESLGLWIPTDQDTVTCPFRCVTYDYHHSLTVCRCGVDVSPCLGFLGFEVMCRELKFIRFFQSPFSWMVEFFRYNPIPKSGGDTFSTRWRLQSVFCFVTVQNVKFLGRGTGKFNVNSHNAK